MPLPGVFLPEAPEYAVGEDGIMHVTIRDEPLLDIPLDEFEIGMERARLAIVEYRVAKAAGKVCPLKLPTAVVQIDHADVSSLEDEVLVVLRSGAGVGRVLFPMSLFRHLLDDGDDLTAAYDANHT